MESQRPSASLLAGVEAAVEANVVGQEACLDPKDMSKYRPHLGMIALKNETHENQVNASIASKMAAVYPSPTAWSFATPTPLVNPKVRCFQRHEYTEKHPKSVASKKHV